MDNIVLTLSAIDAWGGGQTETIFEELSPNDAISPYRWVGNRGCVRATIELFEHYNRQGAKYAHSWDFNDVSGYSRDMRLSDSNFNDRASSIRVYWGPMP